MTTTNLLDFPAIDGRPVTEGHARICRERGHATHKVDGVDQGICPRCGKVTTPALTDTEILQAVEILENVPSMPHLDIVTETGTVRVFRDCTTQVVPDGLAVTIL